MVRQPGFFEVEERLRDLDLLRPFQTTKNGGTSGFVPPVSASAEPQASLSSSLDAYALSRLHFLTTDAPERFARVGSLFLGMSLDPARLELVSL